MSSNVLFLAKDICVGGKSSRLDLGQVSVPVSFIGNCLKYHQASFISYLLHTRYCINATIVCNEFNILLVSTIIVVLARKCFKKGALGHGHGAKS